MRTFIQFKDGVAFSTINTVGETEGVEVFTDKPEQFLNKMYVDGMWVDAPLIRYAILDDTNTVVQVDKTYFSSLVGDHIIIDDPNVGINWAWDGEKFYNTVQFVESIRIPEPEVAQIENVVAE